MSHDVILRPRAGLAHAAAFVALALAAGCGQGGPATAPVVGTVTLDGRPLAGALVLFQPSQGVPARGITDDDGGFSLTTFASGDGALVGPHRVAVSKFTISGVQADASGVSGPVAPGGVKQTWITPQKYASPAESGLEVEVARGMAPVMLELRTP